MAIQSENITLRDGRTICAPADPNLMTNYVLKEQGEWFEDEIGFIETLVEPGMQVLDIGANYGLYSSKISKSLNGKGKLWCFEPTPDTAQCLRATIQLNGYEDVAEVLELGLSDAAGEATFFLSDNAELNSLTETEASQRKITISLDTLDCLAETNGIDNIGFIKLDAEGEEIKILAGAKAFFEANNPLVMFELKHGNDVNVGLIEAFENLGMHCFRLVPGLQVLVPFDKSQAPDGYLLNLFAADDQCIQALSKRGLLVTREQIEQVEVPANRPLPENMCASEKALRGGDYYENILGCYAVSVDDNNTSSVRFRALQTALALIVEKLENDVEQRPERLSSIARIAFDAGARSLGVSALRVIIDNFIVKGIPFQVEEPFLSLEPEAFADKQVDHRVQLAALTVESWLKKNAYSTVFADPKQVRSMIEFQKTIGMLSDYAENLSGIVPGP